MERLCQAQLLGNLSVTQNGRVITRFRDRKTAALFAYLVYFRRSLHPREELVGLFWPDSDERAGRASLSTALNALRGLLEPSEIPRGAVFAIDRSNAQCRPESCATDVTAFETALQQASRPPEEAQRLPLLCAAAERYTGDLLPGFYDDWILTERIRLQTVYLQTLNAIVSAQEGAGQPRRAIETAQRMVAADPLHEEAHETLIRLYSALGETAAARRQYQALARILQKENGAAPDQALKRYWKAAPSSAFPPPRPQNAPPQFDASAPDTFVAPSAARPETPLFAPPVAPRLPLRLTRFFGRAAEMASLREHILDSAVRLITLTGSGGNGKTRLAIETAERLLAPLAGRVWFVPLAEIAAPHQLPAALRDALGIPRHASADPLEQIAEFLALRPALLVLDNLEHLLTANDADDAAASAAFLSELLAKVPELTCLVTSRQPLDLGGELTIELLPLPTPQETARQAKNADHAGGASSATHPPAPDILLANPGVRLFVDRAQSVKPDFQITDNNAAAIAALCERLEGIPLAIELAAARAQVMTPAQMVRQLEAPFDFLASRRKDLAPRHQTLFKTVDWSYRLLAPPFREFFARLSVFRGGWTLEAARAVACPPPPESSEPDSDQSGARELSALDLLAQLRHYSLILAEERGDAMRFRMLEMIRAFAAVQLGPQERRETQRRHAENFLQFAEDAEKELTGPDQVAWLRRVETEHDNLRAALLWAIEDGQTALAVRLGGALGRFWNVRGHYAEAGRWFERILALPGAAQQTNYRARLLRWAGFVQGFIREGRPQSPYFEESRDIYHALGDIPNVITLTGYLGAYMFSQGQREAAQKLYEEAIALAEATGNLDFAGSSLAGLAQFAQMRGDLETARKYQRQNLEIAKAEGNTRGIALTLQRMARSEPDYAKQRVLVKQAYALFRELGDTFSLAMSLLNLAGCSNNLGAYADACAEYTEAVALLRQMQEKDNLPSALASLAELLCWLGQTDEARRAVEESKQIAREKSLLCMARLHSITAKILLAQGDLPAAVESLRHALNFPEGRDAGTAPLDLATTGAALALALQRPERAVVLLGNGAFLPDNTPRAMTPAQRRPFDALVAQARAALPAAEYDAEFAAGQSLAPQAVYDYLLNTLPQ